MGHARYDESAARGRAYDADELAAFARDTVVRILADLNIS